MEFFEQHLLPHIPSKDLDILGLGSFAACSRTAETGHEASEEAAAMKPEELEIFERDMLPLISSTDLDALGLAAFGSSS